ncbi:PREDICTED: GTP-binding protein 10-like [Branchiostoma belcheri]|uniref:GTP-binding protein 10 n=1 Tax=Branchiostoma belcheri TaxID=7741 RepID=A0A6P4Z1Q6_BRABE|nr:PREDICTED: GTP-binding protein 10-like [Branchiostoma belcheri]
MVFLTRILQRAPGARKRGFVDKLRVYVRGGSGGMGLPKYNGRGGDGGHVVFVAKDDLTLKQVIDRTPNKRFIAGVGANATRRAIQGDRGPNLTVEVPTGITVLTDTKQVIANLNQPGDQAVVAKGGQGGAHWSDFLPKKGQIRSVTMELKLISDVGLVGFPNAGKSTLLKAVSSADPKIADYPFTTMRPQIGIVQYKDLRRVSLADLPGLIEGAHNNVGMGHHFLRHVERTKLLLFMVDVHGFVLSMKHPHRTAFQTVALLMKELELYKSDLVDKPAVLAINKMDMTGAGDRAEELLYKLEHFEDSVTELPKDMRPRRQVQFEDIFQISAKEKQGLNKLKDKVREILDERFDEEQNELKQQAMQRLQKEASYGKTTDRTADVI